MKEYRWRDKSSMTLSVVLMVLFAFLGILQTRAEGAPSADTSTIQIGMSTSLTGKNSQTGLQMRLGVDAALARANSLGGIEGRKLNLICLDDGYEPPRTVVNIRQLSEKDKVLAIVGNVGTPTALAALPIINETQTPFFAPYTGAGSLRKQPPQRYLIHFRASYQEEVNEMIDSLVLKGGIKPEEISFFTQRDGFGDAGFAVGYAALQKHGLKSTRKVLHARYERNSLAVEGALASFMAAETPPKALIMVGAYEPCAKFIKLATENNFQPLFLGVSFLNSTALAKKLDSNSARIVITQVTPPVDSNLALVKEYVEDLKKYSPDSVPDTASLEGYIAGRILVMAIEKLKGPPTRESVIDALLSLGDFDIGLGVKLHLSPVEHQASHSVWPTYYKDGKFLPFSWDDIPKLLKKP